MKEYKSIIDEMPVGLERATARLLSFRKGEKNLIERDELLVQLKKQPSLANTEDRQMRLAIQELRNRGLRICHVEYRLKDPHTGKFKVKFGYFIAANDQEYQAFRAKYSSYAQTIWKTLKAMDLKKPILDEEGLIEPPPGIEVQRSFFS